MAKFATSKWPRLVVYSLVCALAIVGLGLSINALVKSNQDISKAKRLALGIAPAGTHIYSSLQDIRIAGSFLATGEVLLGLSGLFGILNILFNISDSKSTRLGTIFLWAFELVWTVASAIATLVIARQRGVQVTADVSGVKIPDARVRMIEQAIGYNPAYWSHSYGRAFAIIPWPLILIAAIALDLAITHGQPASAERTEAPAAEADEAAEASPIKEKHSEPAHGDEKHEDADADVKHSGGS